MKTWKTIGWIAFAILVCLIVYNSIMLVNAINNIQPIEFTESENIDPIGNIVSSFFESFLGPILGISIFSSMVVLYLRNAAIFLVIAIVLLIFLLRP